jgi:putative OPT family oligopeptide transporter
MGFGMELSPVLVGAGYIVGLRVSISMIVGSLITWAVALPVYSMMYGLPDAIDPQVAAMAIWKSKLRFMGIGGMIVGGLWGMISLSKTIVEAVKSSIQAIKGNAVDTNSLPRTERDIPMNYVMMMTLVLSVPLFFLFYSTVSAPLDLTTIHGLVVAFGAAVVSLMIAFGCAAIGAFITGIVGSTLMPISGITISGILMFGLLMFALLAGQIDFAFNKEHALSVATATILFASVIALSSSISGDNMQDLKSGAILGSTPWKQQVMLLVGVVGGALVVGPVLQLLFTAYGIGDVLPREGMDPALALKAPQATLMATMAKGLFAGGIEWNMIYAGSAIAVVVIAIDQYLKTKGHANLLPILAVAFGMYMPASYVLTFFVGGLVSYFASRRRESLKKEDQALSEQRGVLYASGVIAGTALMGVLVSIPLAQGIDVSSYFPAIPHLVVMAGGIGLTGYLMYTLYQKGSTKFG